MNFSILKKMMVLAAVPLMLVSSNHIALAGGGFSTMKPKKKPTYYIYNKSYGEYYRTHDMSRIISETFTYVECSKHDESLVGPWRYMAYKKIEHDPKFASLMPEETQNLLDVVNMMRELATIHSCDLDAETVVVYDHTPPPEEEYVPFTMDDLVFNEGFIKPTENGDFEKIVEECRKEWNSVHDYKEPVHTPEEALEKALRILKAAYGERDPFCNKRVRVSYDPVKSIYRIITERTSLPEDVSYSDYKNMCQSIMLGANGDVISIDCKYDYLRKLV